MMSLKNLICTTIILILCGQQISMQKVLSLADRKLMWLPPGGESIDEYAKREGFEEPTFNRMKQKVARLKEMMTTFFKLPKKKNGDTIRFGDIILSEPQVDQQIKAYQTLLSPGGRRAKRKIVDFNNDPNFKWNVNKPIKFIINGHFSISNQAKIEEAIKDWEDHTCIKFQRVAPDTTINEPHLIFVSEQGCGSKLGRQPESEGLAQSIFLQQSSCLPLKGVAAHEIGHAMGFVHEQMRLDRDTYVRVNFDNVFPKSATVLINFEKYLRSAITTLGVPYDLASVMHYGGFAFSNGELTIVARNPLLQNSMGQRTSLSFYDAKVINKACCTDTCATSISCKAGGIQDPNDCNKCLCPDGYGGNTCETAGNKHTSGCNPAKKVLNVTDTEQCLNSPSYGGAGRYTEFNECNWHLKAPSGTKIEMKFKGTFGVYCVGLVKYCFHWVEIKYKGDLSRGLPGPRFCCDRAHPGPLVSDGDLAVVSFRSKFLLESEDKDKRVGFKLCFKIAGRVDTTTTTTTKRPPTSKCPNVPRPCGECNRDSQCGSQICCETCCTNPTRESVCTVRFPDGKSLTGKCIPKSQCKKRQTYSVPCKRGNNQCAGASVCCFMKKQIKKAHKKACRKVGK